jgi:hypothetical protein
MKNKKRKNKNYTEKVKTGKFATPATIWKEALNQGLIKRYSEGGDLAKLLTSAIPIPGVPQAANLFINAVDQGKEPLNTTSLYKEGGQLRGISQYVGANHDNGGIPIGSDGEVNGMNAVAEAEGGEYKVKFNNLPEMKGTNYIFPNIKSFRSEIESNLKENSKHTNPDTDRIARNTIEMNFKKLMMRNENRKAKEELNTKQFGEGGKLKYSEGGFPPFESMFGALRTMMAPQVSSLGNYGRFSRYKNQLESGTPIKEDFWDDDMKKTFNEYPQGFMPAVEGRPEEDTLMYHEDTEKQVAGSRLATMAMTGFDPHAVINADSAGRTSGLDPLANDDGFIPFDDAQIDAHIKDRLAIEKVKREVPDVNAPKRLNLSKVGKAIGKGVEFAVDKAPQMMRAAGLVGGLVDAFQKPERETPVMPDFTKSDKEFNNMSTDLTQARQDAQAVTNMMSNVNRSASTGFGAYRARQAANYSNLADQLGRIGTQEQQMRNQIAGTRGNYEYQKAMTERNIQDETVQRNLANKAMSQDFRRLALQDLVGEADRLSTQKNIKQLATMNTQLGLAYLSSLAPDVDVNKEMLTNIQKVANGEMAASELSDQELLVYKRAKAKTK